MQRVVVIGGRGFVGRRTVHWLGQMPGISVSVASRSPRQGEVRFDLDDPASFPVLHRFDCVVDCADTMAANPTPAARYCLEHGVLFVETSAVTSRVRELLTLRQQDGPGTAVVGVGLFPGVSNLLAAAVAAEVPDLRSLDLGIRVSPLSGAGRGVSRLMIHQVSNPGYRVAGGREVSEAAVGDRVRLEFSDGPASARRIGLSEPAMLLASTGAPEIAAYLAPVPAALGPTLALLARLLAGERPPPRWVLRLLTAALSVVRGGVLRHKATAVELVAIAGGADGVSNAVASRGLWVSDGMEATACATAAFAVELLERPSLPAGVRLPDELVGLEEILGRLEPLLGAARVTLRRTERAA